MLWGQGPHLTFLRGHYLMKNKEMENNIKKTGDRMKDRRQNKINKE
jgi:hypothetical protein